MTTADEELAEKICDGRLDGWAGPDLSRSAVAILIAKHTAAAVASATKELKEHNRALAALVAKYSRANDEHLKQLRELLDPFDEAERRDYGL